MIGSIRVGSSCFSQSESPLAALYKLQVGFQVSFTEDRPPSGHSYKVQMVDLLELYPICKGSATVTVGFLDILF